MVTAWPSCRPTSAIVVIGACVVVSIFGQSLKNSCKSASVRFTAKDAKSANRYLYLALRTRTSSQYPNCANFHTKLNTKYQIPLPTPLSLLRFPAFRSTLPSCPEHPCLLRLQFPAEWRALRALTAMTALSAPSPRGLHL